MTQSKDPRNRYAAISAFSWVGGADAALSLVLLAADEDPVVAEEAQEILDEVMEELEELDPEEAPIVWEEAIVQITTDGGREALFLSLSGQPQTTSIPILLNFLESDDPDLKEKAGEYLEFVTHGEKIANRAEGEAWLEKYVQEGSPIFSDDIKVTEQDN